MLVFGFAACDDGNGGGGGNGGNGGNSGNDGNGDGGNDGNGGDGAENTFTLNNAPVTSLQVGALDIFVVNQTLTATSGYPAISQAVGHITSGGNTATLIWGANKNATYNVFVSYFIVSEADYVGKFKNGVVFTNGSATLDWNTMETATEF